MIRVSLGPVTMGAWTTFPVNLALERIEPASTYALYEAQREPMVESVAVVLAGQGTDPVQYGQQHVDLAFCNGTDYQFCPVRGDLKKKNSKR